MHLKYRIAFTIFLALLSLPLRAAEHNRLSSAEVADGWRLLFDGKTTSGWRNFQKDVISDGWKVIDGALIRAGRGAGSIITEEQFETFELSLEYKISKGGNSGIMFHVSEEGQTAWMTGPEIQIQDNVDGRDSQLSGWLYQLYKSDIDATYPAGQWNRVRFKITKDKGELWMNGVKYYEFVKGSDDWNQRVSKTKFNRIPSFGIPAKGHICLQDHGNEVAYRNIKIRPL
ncbi:MAG: hypothetical protein M2R45_03975 [Verrucomicrobia subdivision 3 bacterium]|nr:hypothetical protein [Limisphaerales bacterium]MCS1415505.1 hypothetical protein [Limisphaerales bacterium]